MKPDSIQKTQFLNELKMLADDLYSHGDSFEPSELWNQKSSFIDGFVKAGFLFKIAKTNEVQRVIDDAHLQAFNESREERKNRRTSAIHISDEVDWDKYDIPSFTRADK